VLIVADIVHFKPTNQLLTISYMLVFQIAQEARSFFYFALCEANKYVKYILRIRRPQRITIQQMQTKR